MLLGAKTNLLRERRSEEGTRVDFVELFFDLVFVFAVTQVSHYFLEHFTVWGMLESLVLFLAIWWVWIYTSWVTNWLDPHRPQVRIMLFVLMFAGLVLSTSIPDAFGERALNFALAYVFMHVGRGIYMMWALRRHHEANFYNFMRITSWLTLSGAVWIIGALSGAEMRIWWWSLALVIEYVAPAVMFWTPRLGASHTTEWDVDGSHMAERCGLFMIIALGESILVTGATFAGLEWTLASTAAFTVAFAGALIMWWIYFTTSAEMAAHDFAESQDPGRIARIAYTYIHTLLVAGVIVTAVGSEIILVHPQASEAGLPAITAVVGGPLLFLLGNSLFKAVFTHKLMASHMLGIAVLAALGLWHGPLGMLSVGSIAMLVLFIVALWETPRAGGHSMRIRSHI